MAFYHGSPKGGLTRLEPSPTKYFDKPSQVCMTTLRPMALLYLIDHFEYTYGYDRQGHLIYEEYYPHALELLYRHKSGYLYECEEGDYASTAIPNERVSAAPVNIISCHPIADAYETLLNAEKCGEIMIRRYRALSEQDLQRIERFITDDILEKGLHQSDTPYSRYIRQYYPHIWEKT